MCKLRCDSKVIITEKWTVLLDPSHVRQSRIINATAACIRHPHSISRRWNHWGWHNEIPNTHEPPAKTILPAAFWRTRSCWKLTACSGHLRVTRPRITSAITDCMRRPQLISPRYNARHVIGKTATSSWQKPPRKYVYGGFLPPCSCAIAGFTADTCSCTSRN